MEADLRQDGVTVVDASAADYQPNVSAASAYTSDGDAEMDVRDPGVRIVSSQDKGKKEKKAKAEGRASGAAAEQLPLPGAPGAPS